MYQLIIHHDIGVIDKGGKLEQEGFKLKIEEIIIQQRD